MDHERLSRHDKGGILNPNHDESLGETDLPEQQPEAGTSDGDRKESSASEKEISEFSEQEIALRSSKNRDPQDESSSPYEGTLIVDSTTSENRMRRP